MFDWAGFDVELVALERGMTRFRGGGFAFQVEKSFADAGRYDVVWVPGGDPPALVKLIEDPQNSYVRFLLQQAPEARYMCAVCEGAMLLAASGLLDGYRATTHWAFLDCFSEYFPDVRVADGHPRFVLDRDRLTGGGISSGLDEALELIRLLAGPERAAKVQLTTQYFPDPPVSGKIPTPAPQWVLPQFVWCRGSIRAFSSSGPALPYIARLRVLSRLI
jgi:cyclohexyl-isocyanide hydratase